MDPRIGTGIRLDEARALSDAVGWVWTESRVTRLLELEPEGMFTLRSAEGAAQGIVSCVLWGDVAWLGNMIVHPDARRRGIGRALLRHAEAYALARGARTLALDASPAGRLLYEREGYSPSWGESVRCEREGPARAPHVRDGEHAVYPVSSAEIMELIQCDTPRFGAARGRYLASLIGERPHQAFVAIHRRTGAFSGHALAHDERIGPIVADTPAVAGMLLHALERAGVEGHAIVPAWNAAATRLFAGAGYVARNACLRMTKGEPLAGRPAAQFAIGAWALG